MTILKEAVLRFRIWKKRTRIKYFTRQLS